MTERPDRGDTWAEARRHLLGSRTGATDTRGPMGTLGVLAKGKVSGALCRSGDEGASHLTYALIADVARAGGQVAVYDGTSDIEDMMARVQATGLPLEDIKRLTLFDRQYTVEDLSAEDESLLVLTAAARQSQLVVADGWSGIVSATGRSHHPGPLNRFARGFTDAIRSAGAAAWITDQPLRRETDPPRARAGLECVLDVIWSVRTLQPSALGEQAVLAMRKVADRTGLFSQHERYFDVATGGGSVSVTENENGSRNVNEIILGIVREEPWLLTAHRIDAEVARRAPMVSRRMIRQRRQELVDLGVMTVERRNIPEEGERSMPREVYGA